MFCSAQAQYEMKCTMTEREIMQSQSFGEDDPESESAFPIFNSLKTEFQNLYNEINNGEMGNINLHIEQINIAIENAVLLNLNYSMFQEDIEFIQQYN